MKTLSNIIKVLSLVSGAGAYFGWLPPQAAPVAVIVFGAASTLKDLLVKAGDLADNGKLDGSFK